MVRGRIGIALAALLLAGCATPDSGMVVFAAASLSHVLPTLKDAAVFSFDGSSGLVDQLAGGAPADVLATADEATMRRAVAAGLIEGDPVMFATNHLVMVVPTGNPGQVTGLDSSLEGAKLVVCAPEVPCGAATERLAEAAGVQLRPVSEETKVSDVLGKVASGEADAGLVYATDAAHSDAVEVLVLPRAKDFPNTYWVAVVDGAAHPVAARGFVADLTGPWQPRLADAGFGAPR